MRYRDVTMKWVPLFLLAAAATAQKGNEVKLPEGPGKELVERVCGNCHGLENVVRARMTKERWGMIVDDMVSRGATATDAEVDQIVDYLAANFSKPKPQEEKK